MAHFRHSRKWTQTWNPNYAYIMPCINGDDTATWLATNILLISALLNRSTSYIWWDDKDPWNSLTLQVWNVSSHRNLSYQRRNFLPFIPMGILPSIFWRCDLFGVKGLSCGVICVILHLAVLIQYRSVTDTHTHTHTHTQTDRQTDTRRRHIPRLARRRAVKMGHVSKTTPLLRVICHPFGQTWYRLSM